MHYLMKTCTMAKLDWSRIGVSEAAIYVFKKPGNPCCAHLRQMQSVSCFIKQTPVEFNVSLFLKDERWFFFSKARPRVGICGNLPFIPPTSKLKLNNFKLAIRTDTHRDAYIHHNQTHVRTMTSFCNSPECN
jgi:hypothetical protein